MRNLLFFLAIWLVSAGAFAQNNAGFEGIIEMTQTNSKNERFELKWYLKGEKVAYEMTFNTPDGKATTFRFCPNLKENTLIMSSPDGSFRQAIPASGIVSPLDLTNNPLAVREIGKTTGSGEAKNILQLEGKNFTTITTIEVAQDIPFDFKPVYSFFKGDYGVASIVQANLKGFPINSTTTDPEGRVLVKNALKSIKRTKVSDSVFE